MEQHLHHDPDLIADYAEGLLAESNEARRLVDVCSECRREYELQRAVKGALGNLAIAELTDIERSQLHAAVSRVPAGNVVTLTDRRRVQWWMRVASVAAAAFVLIGLGTVFIGMLRSGSQEGTFDTASANLEAGSAAESLATTTAAATLQGEEFASDSTYRLLDGGDADAVRAEINAMLEGPSVDQFAEAAQRDQACLEEVDRQVLDVAQSRLDGRPIVIVIVAADDGKEALVYDEATCLLVEIPPE